MFWPKTLSDDAKYIGSKGGCDDAGARFFSPNKERWAMAFPPKRNVGARTFPTKEREVQELFLKKKRKKQ